jgi:chromosome segregation ATPase
MLNLFKNIFKSKKNSSTKNSGYHHLKNIISGPKVIIDGKVFVKVKLRFVDTLDFNITRFVDRLETEIESQKLEIERQSCLLAENEKLIHDLQTLNVNLLHDLKAKPLRLREKISTLTAENKNKKKEVSSVQDECYRLKEKINQLNGQTIKAQNIVTEKDNTIKSLEQTISWLKASDKGIISLVDSNTRLRKELKATRETVEAITNECDKRDSMIQFLTKKIRDYEQQVYMLETKFLEEKKEAE